jgi:hypothetical protein
MPDDETKPNDAADDDDEEFELPSLSAAELDASEIRRRVADDFAESGSYLLLVALLIEQRLMCMQIALVEAIAGDDVTGSLRDVSESINHVVSAIQGADVTSSLKDVSESIDHVVSAIDEK